MSTIQSEYIQTSPNEPHSLKDVFVLIHGSLNLMWMRMMDKLRVVSRLTLADCFYGHDAYLRKVNAVSGNASREIEQ